MKQLKLKDVLAFMMFGDLNAPLGCTNFMYILTPEYTIQSPRAMIYKYSTV